MENLKSFARKELPNIEIDKKDLVNLIDVDITQNRGNEKISRQGENIRQNPPRKRGGGVMFGRYSLNKREYLEYLLLRTNWRIYSILAASDITAKTGDQRSYSDTRMEEDLRDIQKGCQEFLRKMEDPNYDTDNAYDYIKIILRAVDDLYASYLQGKALYRAWAQANS